MPAAPAALLTDARWRKAISAVRALGRRGVRVLTCDATRLVAAAVSRYVERHLVLPAPARDPEGFVAAVARLAGREPRLVCFPLEDPTLAALSAARDRLPGGGLPLAPPEAIAGAPGKAAAPAAGAALGLPVAA